jgi:homospermidine synthase
MNRDWNISNINKINLGQIKILFLGYGGVAKCVLNYFKYFFDYNIKNIYIIDKYEKALYGPVQDHVPRANILFVKVQCENFDHIILEKLKFKKGDLIIDLTFASNTYYFVKRCLELDINYINTSIEDGNDDMEGSSIALQQIVITNLYKEIKSRKKISCNVLLEFGQNPGLIQHYIIFALNELNKLKYPGTQDIWEIEKLKQVITDHKIGTILSSEIDNIHKTKDIFDIKSDKIYNTWSVSGLLGEGLDNAELSYGKKNKFVKPKIPNYIIDDEKSKIFDNTTVDNKISYDLLFLNDSGINCTLNSICPGLDSYGNIVFINYEGRLIHHGEMFELADKFGSSSPFMSYCYKINKYADYSIRKYMGKSVYSNPNDLSMKINSINKDFFVYDNYNSKPEDLIIGWDSVGCTIFCGKNKIDSIYWCGTILSSTDLNLLEMFTPTIVQVAAGVLSGISYIMDPDNSNKGMLMPTDLYTPYILSKAVPLLGKFFFTEIPAKEFSKSGIKFNLDKIL